MPILVLGIFIPTHQDNIFFILYLVRILALAFLALMVWWISRQ